LDFQSYNSQSHEFQTHQNFQLQVSKFDLQKELFLFAQSSYTKGKQADESFLGSI